MDIIRTTIIELEIEAKDNSSSNSNNIKSRKPFSSNRVKALQLDNKFKSRDLDNYLTSKSIITRYFAPYSPKLNSAAEIINRALLNKARALLLNGNLLKFQQDKAIHTATYLYNRTTSSFIESKTSIRQYNKTENQQSLIILINICFVCYELPRQVTSLGE